MDSNEINFVTAKFTKISEQIKESLALLTEKSDPFSFSEPEELVEPISVLTSVCIPKFSFCEPFQKPKVEDCSIVDELTEIISSLNIHGSEYESTIHLELPLKSNDEVKDNIETIIDGFEDSDTVPWVKSCSKVVSTDNKQNTQIHEPWDCFDNPFIFPSGFELDSNYQALNVRHDLINGLAEQVDDIDDNNESDKDADSCHIHKQNQRIIQHVLCNEEQNIPVDCNEVQDIDINSISNHENIQASSTVQNLDSHNSEQDITKEVLQKDENENIPLSKIPIADGGTTNVEVLTPNDNSPTHACRSGDLDPNTQIADGRTANVDVLTPNNNSPTHACRSGDLGPNTQIADGRTTNVDVLTPNNNSPTHACRSGDLDPNTQIGDGRTKSVEVLSPNDNSPTHACRSGDLDPNTQIADGRTANVDVLTPNNNSPTHACRSGDLDPSTQIVDGGTKSVEVLTPRDNSPTHACRSEDLDPNTQIADGRTTNVDVLTPNNNSPTHACRSGGIDPSTQIADGGTKSIEVLTTNDNSPTYACRFGDLDPNTQIVGGRTTNVDVLIPSDNSPTHACRSGDLDPNTQIADGRTTNVDVLTPNNNSPTHACRSGDLDPNTQITHVELGSPVAPPPKIYESQPLPFLVKDVHKITWPNQEEVVFPPVSYLFGQTFKSVMIYGLVTSLTVEEGGLKQRFVIDDGSDSINVVWKASDQIVELIKMVHHLSEEVKRCRKTGMYMMNQIWSPNSKECKEMLDSFDKIIHYIKRNITERTKLKMFEYAAVVGKVFRSKNKKVQLYATFIEDNSRDRSLELYFKKNLIRLYEKKYMPNK